MITENFVFIRWNYLELGSQRTPESSSCFKIAKSSKQLMRYAPDYNKGIENIKVIYTKSQYEAIARLRRYFVQLPYLPKDFDEVLKDKNFKKIYEGCEPSVIKMLEFYQKGVYHWWYNLAYEYNFTGKQRELVHGYSGIVKTIFNRLDPDAIYTNKEVINIDWLDCKTDKLLKKKSNISKIKIKCRDNTTYEADHVIITVPLGYLKENYETLFSPTLPEEKISAIKELNFETINKIYLKFDKPFWNLTDVYHVIWQDKIDMLFEGIKHQNGKDPKEWVKYINRFEYVYTKENVLCAWIWGEGAKIMESLPEKEVANCCMVLLQYLTGKNLPKPLSIIRSKWHSNPLFRGSVVYDPSRPIYDLLCKVSETISVEEEPLIQFTGDVADMDLVSSVEGARKTGTRAAMELYTFYAFEANIPFYYHATQLDLD